MIPPDVLALSRRSSRRSSLAAAILVVDFVAARPARAGAARHVHGPGAWSALHRRRAGAGRGRRARRPSVTAFDGAYAVDPLTTFLDLLFVAIVGADGRVRPGLPRGTRPAGRRVRGGARVRDVGRDAHRGLRATSWCCSWASSSWSCRATCWRATTSRTATAPRARSSTSCSARSRSAIFLFGLAFVWGLTGTTRIDGRRGRSSAAIADRRGPLAPGLGDGPRVPDDRRRVQDRGGPVPLLDAGRLPGLADAGDRLPLGRARRSGAFALIIRLFAEALGAARRPSGWAS